MFPLVRTVAAQGPAARFVLLLAFALGTAFAFSGCRSPQERMRGGSVLARMLADAQESAHAMPAPPVAGFATVATAGADGRPFLVEARRSAISRYPCAGCHTQPLARMKAGVRPGAAPTHGGIAQAHADGAKLTCTDCHDDGADLARLRLRDGARVSLDESFRLCGQCHAPQARDWQGGAHGKRLMGWAGPRVVRACTGCHNPHDPLNPVTTPRWPALVPNAPLHAAHAE